MFAQHTDLGILHPELVSYAIRVPFSHQSRVSDFLCITPTGLGDNDGVQTEGG
jgi:hypothetical protein